MRETSKRELEQAVADLNSSGEGPDRIILTETAIGTEYDGSDLEPGETETSERVIEL
jgi:hypothetical protein